MTLSGLIYMACSCAALAPATASAQIAFGGEGPIQIKADKATYKDNMTILEGQVDVRQDVARIQSDSMDIYRQTEKPQALADGLKSSSLKLGGITRIVAKGHFRYSTPDNVVTGDEGIYESLSQIITVSGNVTFKQPNGSLVKGDKLIYDVTTKTAKFGNDCYGEQCSGRVFFSSTQPD